MHKISKSEYANLCFIHFHKQNSNSIFFISFRRVFVFKEMWLKLFLLVSILCASTSRPFNNSDVDSDVNGNALNSNEHSLPQQSEDIDELDDTRSNMDLNKDDNKLFESPPQQHELVKKDTELKAVLDEEVSEMKKVRKDFEDTAQKWTIIYTSLAIGIPVLVCILCICTCSIFVYCVMKKEQNDIAEPTPPPPSGESNVEGKAKKKSQNKKNENGKNENEKKKNQKKKNQKK